MMGVPHRNNIVTHIYNYDGQANTLCKTKPTGSWVTISFVLTGKHLKDSFISASIMCPYCIQDAQKYTDSDLDGVGLDRYKVRRSTEK